eukprot:scaffold488_cov372-Prasinococcus_capsulatus_cf.AAC.9
MPGLRSSSSSAPSPAALARREREVRMCARAGRQLARCGRRAAPPATRAGGAWVRRAVLVGAPAGGRRRTRGSARGPAQGSQAVAPSRPPCSRLAAGRAYIAPNAGRAPPVLATIRRAASWASCPERSARKGAATVPRYELQAAAVVPAAVAPAQRAVALPQDLA